jgi:hypothetical protein
MPFPFFFNCVPSFILLIYFFIFIGLQRSASTLLSLICFQETPQAQDNVDSLKGTHFSYTLLTVLSLFVK